MAKTKLTMKDLQKDLKAIQTATDKAVATIKLVFPFGTTVYWSHGNGTRKGLVIGHSTTRTEVWVEGITGAKYWQDAGWIIRSMLNQN